MIDLSKLDPADAERIAYAEGFTGVAALYARLSDAEHLNSTNEDEIDKLRDQVSDLETKTSDREDDLSEEVSDLEAKISDLEDDLEDMRQTLLQCLPFFEDRKEEIGETDNRTMDFMIRLIKQSLGETD